ncbi:MULTISPECIES: hypothetical protein [unclassified Shewanella]|uniref:hypothetical protein n=1 Tax=unclassified Shewanella TaxID=196818 RepID=UPI001BB84B22|nr:MULTISPECIES: hypothetical protein [unclassified Shewanella]GIU21225.1 hypothetical protein TUM4444_40470 [Shewanella sp. MBTL60-112-B1]GIU33539.1 hypothetical protein TUM4445_20820 [Shewanella sp. MBTL60-112-B2]
MLAIANQVLLTEVEAAAAISCSLSALQKSRSKKSTKIDDGLAPRFIKENGAIRYLLSDLEEFVSNLMPQDMAANDSACDRADTAAENGDVEAAVKKPAEDDAFDWSTLI